MVSMPKELANQIEEYARAQTHYLDMIHRQQHAIEFFNAIMKTLLEETDKKKSWQGKKSIRVTSLNILMTLKNRRRSPTAVIHFLTNE